MDLGSVLARDLTPRPARLVGKYNKMGGLGRFLWRFQTLLRSLMWISLISRCFNKESLIVFDGFVYFDDSISILGNSIRISCGIYGLTD